MKTLTTYQCEICNKIYDTSERAIACEAEGIFDSSKYPIGWMHEHNHNGYVGIFAIAYAEKSKIGSIHMGDVSYWCFRGKPYPPHSLDDELCGNDYVRSDDEGVESFIKYKGTVTLAGTKRPEFKKMVDYLVKKGITPFYYDEAGIKNVYEVK